jgi:electron transport complex protein RnfC
MGLKTFPGGVHPHDYKEFSKDAKIETLSTPKIVRVPLSQHIGAPAKVIVKKGDDVVAFQKIAEPAGFVSIPMHSPISGKVTAIGDFLHPNGTLQAAIEITSDGEEKQLELTDDANYMKLSKEEMKKRIAEAGICGMGGAGFPTHVKLSPPANKPIDTIILNGVECEPFLTSDYRLMLEEADQIIKGLEIIMAIVSAKKGYIGIEANKPDAIKLMQDKVRDKKNIEVVSLKIKYPQGAEKQLIYAATKRKVPNKGGLPMDVGVVVQNVGTAAAVYEAVRYQKPLVERIIAVTGNIVKNPKNFKAKVGTLYSDLVDACDGATQEIGKIISGGPMMGFAVPSLDASMTKGSSGLLLFDEKMAKSNAESTCLRCARCVDVCPLNLLPSIMANAAKYEDWDQAEKAGVMDCMKCGTCAYVCPANIKLIQWIDIGKTSVGAMMRERNKK